MNISQYPTISFLGWSPESKENSKKINNIKNVINDPKNKKIAISGHTAPDGDSIGATFAMAYLLNHKTKKVVDVYVSGSLPQKYKYLKGNGINIIDKPVYDTKTPKYDLAISLDTAEDKLMDKDYKQNVFNKAKKTVKIDHHPSGNNYADVEFTDPTASAASQLVMQFVEPMGINPKSLPEKFNYSVYNGIISDTGRFSYMKSSLPFKDAQLLVENGVDLKTLEKNDYKVPRAVKEYVNSNLKNITYSPKGNIAYLVVDTSSPEKKLDLNQYKLALNQLKYAVHSQKKEVEGVKATLFITKGKDATYISGRSIDKDISSIAVKHGGGGHKYATAFKIPTDENTDNNVQKIVEEYDNYLDD